MSADTSTTFRKELLTLEEQKGQIEKALTWYLSRGSDLTDRQKYLLRNALGHTYRGLFSIARQDIHNLALAESAWSPSAAGSAEMVNDVTHQALCRSLAYLRGTPEQYPPVFR